MSNAFDLATTPVHLGFGATAVVLEPFDGSMAWYERYGASTLDDGIEGRLVSLHTFTEPWPTWEVHPEGHELVLCTAGEMTLIQQLDTEQRTVLRTGQAAINPPGIWHTADIESSATALFITAGVGTENRPR